eukprot:370829_1
MADTQTFCDSAIEATATLLTSQFLDYPDLANKFKSYCIEEAFDEITVLIEDVADGFEESALLEAISDDIEIKENDKNVICHTIYQSLINFTPPPTTLNLTQIDTIDIEEKEMDEMKEKLTKEASYLIAKSNDKTLLNLLIIAKQNHFPLLTYLVDTYSRWKLYKYEKLFKELNKYDILDQRQQFIGKYMKTISEKDFVKEFAAIKQLKLKSKNNEQIQKLILLYEHSIPTFYRRITASMDHPFKSEYVINDSLVQYSKYFIAMLYAINNIIQAPTTQLPLQIDFWVIPKAMARNRYNGIETEDTDDDDDDGSEEESKQSMTQLSDIKSRLKFTKNLIEMDIGG